jgi:hypothetical protein
MYELREILRFRLMQDLYLSLGSKLKVQKHWIKIVSQVNRLGLLSCEEGCQQSGRLACQQGNVYTLIRIIRVEVTNKICQWDLASSNPRDYC